MSENYKIMSKFIKDISGETPDIETYLYVKDFISKYQLNIEINSKALKKQIIEVNTILKFHDNSESKKKSHFEMTYTSVIKLNEEIEDKNIIQKIILCDVQKEIFPEIEKALLNLLHTSGYPNIKFEKKVDFDELYKKQFNSKIFAVNYDLLVTNPKTIIKSLIKWLGWDWNEKYLSPHNNQRTVLTASNVQVRSPINSKSIGGWRNYKEILKPAIEILTKTDKYRDLISL